MVINSAGPVSSKNQSKRWLLFQRDIMNPAGSDVSDQCRSVESYLFIFFYLFYADFNSVFSISAGRRDGRLV